jgi:hypothetical protein
MTVGKSESKVGIFTPPVNIDFAIVQFVLMISR